MSRARVTGSSAGRDSWKQAARHPADARSFAAAPARGFDRLLQERPACACGGGCPRCLGSNATRPAALLNEAAASSASPLPADVQQRFGAGLGVDLRGVRVHSSASSTRAADALAARAYTIGQDIHFADGEYDPASREGQRLLAHEVVHTLQQPHHRAPARGRLDVSSPEDATEHEADRIAESITSGRGNVMPPAARPVATTRAQTHVARDDKWSAAYGTRKTHTGLTIEQYQKAMGTGDFSKGQGIELQKAASAYGQPKRRTMTITTEQLFAIFPDLKKDVEADDTAAPEAKRNLRSKVDTYAANLTEAFKVMQIDTVAAQALYLAHAFVESDQFRIMSETVRTSDRYQDDPTKAKLDETYLNQKYMVASEKQLKADPKAVNKYATTVNPLKAAGKTSGWDQSFIGRGPLQVTHRAIYVQVIAFLEKRAEQADGEKDADTAAKARAAANAIKEDPRNAADPKYAFLVSAAFMQMAGGVRRSAKLGKDPDFKGLGPESVWMTGRHLESTDVIDKPKLKADAFKRAVEVFTKADEEVPREHVKNLVEEYGPEAPPPADY